MLWVLLQSSTLGAPPPLLKRFTATMYSDQSETDSLHVTTTSSVLVYEGAESTPTGGSIGVVQTSSPLIDHRVTTAAGWYAANLSDTASLARTGVYAHTPFFEYQTCDIFSIPFVGPPNDYHEETFAQAWESLFNVDFSGIYAGALSTGRVMTIGDASCDVWRFNTSNGGLVTNALFCLKMVQGSSSALLLSLNYSQVEGTAFFKNSTNVLTRVAAVTALPQRPTAAAHCVDLRPPTSAASALTTHERVNDEARIATINAAAKGTWRARASSHFSSATTVAELNAHLMPSRPAHRQARVGGHRSAAAPTNLQHHTRSSVVPVPAAFDAREQWGAQCPSLGTVRDQGLCGSCWAFGAVEALADRLCIASLASTATTVQNVSTPTLLSPEFLLDCDAENAGCGGGLLDDAWYFLNSTGVPSEACIPYQKQRGPSNPAIPCYALHKCLGGSEPEVLYTTPSGSAYAAGAPGDVAATQREILARGPVEVAFQVFADFHSYHDGVYVRTKESGALGGGHAVKIVGWGEEKAVPYWWVANSWGATWGGLSGFFKIRRGTNECGIEQTMAAG